MNPLNSIGNEIRLCYFCARRYWLESVAAFMATLSVFAGLVYAVVALGGSAIASGKLDGLLIGFSLWMFASTTYAGTANQVAEEIRQRTLEQLYIASMPLWQILGIRALIKTAGGACLLFAMLATIHLMLGGRLQMPYLQMMATMLLAAPSLIGLGYMMSGFLLLARKAEAVQMLVYPALIGVIAYPAYPLNIGSALPFSLGASMTRQLGSGNPLPWSSYLALSVVSLAWLLAGLAIFHWLDRHARRLGVIGHL